MIVDKDPGRQIHTYKSKLCLLNKNIHADFITTMKTTIEIQMRVIPMTTTYSAIANYSNTVNQIFPNEYAVKRNNRGIQKSFRGGRRGRGGYGHQGCGGRGGCGVRDRGTARKKMIGRSLD